MKAGAKATADGSRRARQAWTYPLPRYRNLQAGEGHGYGYRATVTGLPCRLDLFNTLTWLKPAQAGRTAPTPVPRLMEGQENLWALHYNSLVQATTVLPRRSGLPLVTKGSGTTQALQCLQFTCSLNYGYGLEKNTGADTPEGQPRRTGSG